MLFKLEKPDLSKIDQGQLMMGSVKYAEMMRNFIQRVSGQEYLYWDKVRYKEPSPTEFTKEEFWVIIKFWRVFDQIKSVIKGKTGNFYSSY